MDKTHRLQSLFSQQLDRSVFATYFLGAVVPLVALVLVAREYVLPSLAGEDYGTAAVVGGIVGVGVLTLVAFLALRRLTRNAVTRMDEDNRKLAQLLVVSGSLAGASHASSVAETAVRCALELSGARAAFAVLRSNRNKPLSLHESAGEHAQALYQAHEEELVELAEQALAQGGPSVMIGDTGQRKDATRLAAACAVPLQNDGSLSGAIVVAETRSSAGFSPAQVDGLKTLAALVAVALDNVDLKEAQRNFFTYVTEMLVAALDSYVDTRKGHATQVARLSNRLGRELGLDEPTLERLHFGSLLHDIGMLKVDPARQRDPKAFRSHPKVGHRMLSRVRLWEEVAPIVLHHHERFDGTGYPEGLRGNGIPLEARIVAVTDAFDAMVREDGPRSAKSLPEAMQELRDSQGSQFDPAVVDAFARLVERGDVTLD